MVEIRYVLVFALCFPGLNVLHAEEPVERNTWKIRFEGNESFDTDTIRTGLALDVPTQRAATAVVDDELPIDEYLSLLERRIVRGYQSDGFRDAHVSAKANHESGMITATISEGLCYLRGDVTVTGLSETENKYVTSLLLHPSDGKNPFEKSRSKLKFWKPKSCMSFLDWPEDDFRPVVQNALLAIGKPQATFSIEFPTTSNEDKHTVDMQIQVTNADTALTVGDIIFFGLEKHTREQMLEFLELKSGMPLTLQLRESIVRRLLDSGRFLMAEVTHAPFLFDPSESLELKIRVHEYDLIAPLGQELTESQQALRKLSGWLSNWQNGDADLRVRITCPAEQASAVVQSWVPGEFRQFCNSALGTGMPGRLCVDLITSPNEGSVLKMQVTDPQGQVTLQSTVLLTRSIQGLVAWQSKKKWLHTDRMGLICILGINGQWPNKDDHKCLFSAGYGITANEQNGVQTTFNCTAAAVIHSFSDAVEDITVVNGLQKLKLKSGQLELDAAAGSLSKLSVAIEDANFEVSSGNHLVVEELVRLQNEAQDWPNQCQPGRELPALAAMILDDVQAAQSENSDAIAVCLDLLSNEAALKHLTTGLEKLKDFNWFSIPQENKTPPRSDSDLLNFVPLMVNWLPVGSFPHRFGLVTYDAYALHNDQPLMNRLFLEVLKNEDPGAVWFGLVARLVWQSDLSQHIAKVGLERLSTDSFQRDVAPLINEPSHVRELLCAVVIWLQQTSDDDAEKIARVIATKLKDQNEQPVDIRPLLVLVRSQRDKAPEDVLTSIVPFVWEHGLKDWVEADLKILAVPKPSVPRMFVPIPAQEHYFELESNAIPKYEGFSPFIDDDENATDTETTRGKSTIKSISDSTPIE